jgi:Putative lumazine-binding
MTTPETETERGAITRAIEAYIDGARTGDADKLKEAFDERAWMFGSLGGQRVDIPITEMIEMVKAQPMGET